MNKRSAKRTNHRSASSKLARDQQVARKLLVGESIEALCREYGLAESDIQRVKRRCEVDLAAESDGSAALRWRQTLQLEGLLEIALEAWRAGGASDEERRAGDVKFLTLARQTLQDIRSLWGLAGSKMRPAPEEPSPESSGEVQVIEDPGWFGETPLYKALLPHILEFQASSKNGKAPHNGPSNGSANGSANGLANGNGHHRNGDGHQIVIA